MGDIERIVRNELLKIGIDLGKDKYPRISFDSRGIAVNYAYDQFMFEDSAGYHYVTLGVRESEYTNRVYPDMDSMLYDVYQVITHNIASQYAAAFGKKHPEADFRQVMFARQLELLNAIRPEFAMKRRKEIDEILQGE